MSGGDRFMPFNTGDYISTTRHLTTVEHGAYFLLAMTFWNTGTIPTDDKKLARIVGLSPYSWIKIKDTVLGLWNSEGARYWTPEARPPISPADREFVLNKFKSTCVYCGDKDGPFEIDHVEPYVRGGQHSISNFALSCGPCNRAKGTKTLAEWRALS